MGAGRHGALGAIPAQGVGSLLARPHHAGAPVMSYVERGPVHSGAFGGRQQGVALAIVVWFIAGMSLLVAGIVAQARVDTHMAQVHVARAKAAAAGDGAIQLMMVDLMTSRRTGGHVPVGRYRVGDIEATVLMVPEAGLIDIGSAQQEVLFALFLLAGRLPEEQARLLAETVVKSRSAAADQGVRLHAVEDLLRVPGFSRTLLDAVRDFIVVGGSSGGAINWSQAPEALLEILARANPAQADAVRARRGNAGGSKVRSDGGQAASVSGAYRADAIVRYGDKTWLRRRWLSIETSSSSALPWRFTRTEPPRVLMEDSFLLGRSVDA
jgi:general secretion pathway protein K